MGAEMLLCWGLVAVDLIPSSCRGKWGRGVRGSVLEGGWLTVSFLGMWEENISAIKPKHKPLVSLASGNA